MTLKETPKIGWQTAATIVIANMIGTGVFTSLGFQLESVSSTWSIVLLWLIGGFMSLIGAFIYAELGTHFRKSGGDYVFLSETIHPLLGYLYAWTSLTVGFSAPIAIAAMAMVYYLKPVLTPGNGMLFGALLIIMVSLFHSFSVKNSGRFHVALTVVKIFFAVAIAGAGFLLEPAEPNGIDLASPWIHEILLPGFAVSLIYVSYAYTGWNAAAYIVEEINMPQRNLPKALLIGTLFVTVVYVLLQLAFLRLSPTESLTGQVDVALVAFQKINSGSWTPWISALISFQLISTISGYVWIGPRITYSMARDYQIWNGLSKTNSAGIPVRALWFNSAISIVLLVSGSFEQILLYASFVLQLMGTLTIASSLRLKLHPENFRAPWRPLLPLLYIFFSVWILGYTLYERPIESLIGVALVGIGGILFKLDKRIQPIPKS